MATSARSRRPDGSGLSRTFLRNTICDVNRRGRRLKGVLFGSCKFGDARNLIEVLRPSKVRGQTVKNRLVWAAGYGEEIDYTRSSLFDIYFYDLLFRSANGGDEITRLETTVEPPEPGVAGAGRQPLALDHRPAPERQVPQHHPRRESTRTEADGMATFTGFGPKALPFFEALKFHQDRAWFEENRGLYESDVLAPMVALIDDLTASLRQAARSRSAATASARSSA